MLSDADILDLRPVLLAQSRLLRNIEGAVAESAARLSDVAAQVDDIANLQRMMDDIESNAHLLRADDLAEFDPASIPHLYESRRASTSCELVQLGYRDWPSFVRQCEQYILHQGLDPFAPYEALLTKRDLGRLRTESYGAELRWDRWDYVAMGVSALLAVLTDVLLVRTPATSPLTRWLKRYNTNRSDDWFAQWANTLANEC
jgi:hypothetical protein